MEKNDLDDLIFDAYKKGRKVGRIEVKREHAENQRLIDLKLPFTNEQIKDIKEIKDILEKFKCNIGIKLDCSKRCPFRISGEPAIHKYSAGCFHNKLVHILNNYNKLKRKNNNSNRAKQQSRY